MPEGDTVWLAARRMHQALAGEVLTQTEFRIPALATVDLAGREVIEVVSRGKHMLTRIAGDVTLHTHFMLTGAWHVDRIGTQRPGGPAHEVRVILRNDEWQAIGYRLPRIEPIATDRERDAIGHLGPDLLGDDWDEAEVLRRLRSRPDREIGDALLDQRNLAGIGNLYKTEVLFLTGLTPWVTLAAVPDLTALIRRVRRLMMANRGHAAQSTTGNLRHGQDHWVFERADRPCRRCSTPIRQARQGQPPHDRISYWCPSCQSGPAAVVGDSAPASRPA